jgi:ribonuclease-3 family protein
MNEDFFDEDEISIIKRARNHKGVTHPKNCDIVTYKHATALEALIGYLKLENKEERIDSIMKRILGGSIC